MKNIFCTVFDRNYLTRGLVLYFSLQKNCSNGFQLYVLCMDDSVYRILQAMNLEGVIPISLLEFENEELLKVKKERTAQEYSWTCGSNFCRYLLLNRGVESITYLDADMEFYADPQIIFKEIGNSSVAILEHRFSGNLKRALSRTGIYNISWISFKNDEMGLRVVRWWADEVLKWCYNRYEDGKFGDQKYLDDWLERFPGVKVIQTLGAGIAPWNILNYKFSLNEAGDFLVDGSPLVFYHFQAVRFLKNGKFLATTFFHVPAKILHLVYRPYAERMGLAMEKIRKIEADFKFGLVDSSWTERLIGFLFRFRFLNELFFWVKGFAKN